MTKPKKVKEDAEEVNLPEGEGRTSEEVEVAAKSGVSKAGKVVFTLRDRNSAAGKKERVFSEEEHGEGYADLADQFEKANQSEILHRE